ncbi:DUF4349 domain-containing protein [Solwaraspora sp. WMMB335]|uniref:DUF4349 domain-containing protein n=1 Tax=Solwaraspora sp. WMMB335 TaxID=3404118 RepID=UPI003B9505E2
MIAKSRRNHRRLGGRRGVAAAGAVTLLGLVILSGCSGSDSGESTDMSTQAEAPVQEDGGAADGADTAGGGAVERQREAAPADDSAQEASAGGAAPADLRVGNRSIIYSGSITIEVTEVSAKAAEAATIARSVGGFVGRDQRSEYDSYGRATLELRVPAAEFDVVVDRLSRLGEELSRELSTQDVTEEVIDLDARIATQEARVRSGRALLARAETLAELVMLEGELARREADLAALQARKRGLDDLITLSRITVELVGPDATPPEEESELGFLSGLAAGWRAFVASLRVLVTVIGALLPWLIALGVPALGVLWLVRAVNRRTRLATSPGLTTATVPTPREGAEQTGTQPDSAESESGAERTGTAEGAADRPAGKGAQPPHE